MTGLLPNTRYVLYRRYSNTQLCRVGGFTTEPGSIVLPTSTTSKLLIGTVAEVLQQNRPKFQTCYIV